MFVAGGEDDAGGLVADEALGDPGVAKVGGGSAALLEHRGGVDHLHDEGVAAGARPELVHLGEDRLPLRWLRLLRLLLSRRRH